MIGPIIAGAGILSKLLGGGAQGAATERNNQNRFTLDRNQQDLSRYGTQQQAILSSLLGASNEATNRYNTNQGATTNAMQGRQGAVTHALDAQSAENLNRAQLGLQAPTVRARQSILGSVMKNLQPTQMVVPEGQRGHVPTMRGGLNASALDPTTRQHGDELAKAALMAQLSGSDVPDKTDFMGGVQDWGSTVLAPPSATDFKSGLIAPPELGGYKSAGKGESIMSGASVGGGILGEILKLIEGAQAPTSGNGLPIDAVGGG